MNKVRLIDANALKFTKVAEVNGVLTHVLTAEDINNATTVEERSYDQGVINGKDTEFDNGFEQGYAKGYENCEHDNERTQGEWIVNNYGEHICSNCGHYALSDEVSDNEYEVVLSDFCPNCGADMRGNKK